MFYKIYVHLELGTELAGMCRDLLSHVGREMRDHILYPHVIIQVCDINLWTCGNDDGVSVRLIV